MLTIVAPYAGAWIEILFDMHLHNQTPPSLPTRERGLKFIKQIPAVHLNPVAPYAGAWIEIALIRLP